ncbi:uncharacterized protein KY384_006647 [Bacidia gigantensis]|uniref:uncharacterized protein n=1 Tax=Bacidia gigantensis TaxID=2732470 RepID=UPI001D04AAC1|nr:uncharacterized protein KY384_006647 [Bacidia gigantensis]KAG8528958.1 hypothetical protein KY384_006647 [Bacidia gigantensis]
MSAPNLRARTSVPAAASVPPTSPSSTTVSTPPKRSASQAAAKEDNVRVSFFDVVRALSGLILLSTLLSYLITGTSLTWGYKPSWARPARIRAWLKGPLNLTDAELSLYNGTDASLPILLALNGSIYDVSASPHIYGPGGMYHVLSGRDATRAFVTGCFDVDLNGDLRGVEEMFIPIPDSPQSETGEGEGGISKEVRTVRKLLREKETRVARKKVYEAVEGWRKLFDGGKGGKYFWRGMVDRRVESGWEGWGAKKELCEKAKQGRGRREADEVVGGS